MKIVFITAIFKSFFGTQCLDTFEELCEAVMPSTFTFMTVFVLTLYYGTALSAVFAMTQHHALYTGAHVTQMEDI